MIDETHSWGPGGIFGQAYEDVVEVLDEMGRGPYPDGMGGFRSRPGLGNRLGAEDEIQRRRDQKKRRDAMLLVERFIDELPDLRDKFLESLGPDGMRGKIRERLVDMLAPGYREGFLSVQPGPISVTEAFGRRIAQTSLDATSEVFLRAYNRDIRRGQAAVRLGAFEPEEWAAMQAQKVLATPSAIAAGVMGRARALAARVKHVANAISEPLAEPEPEAQQEPAPEEDLDGRPL